MLSVLEFPVVLVLLYFPLDLWLLRVQLLLCFLLVLLPPHFQASPASPCRLLDPLVRLVLWHPLGLLHQSHLLTLSRLLVLSDPRDRQKDQLHP